MDFAKRAMPSSAYAPTATLQAVRGATNPAFAAASQKEYGLDYYLRSALAGGLCCGITHGAVTPVDVVKVRLMRARVSRFLFWYSRRARLIWLRRRMRFDSCLLMFTDDFVCFTSIVDTHATRPVQVQWYAQRFPQGGCRRRRGRVAHRSRPDGCRLLHPRLVQVWWC
jgi:hypothetical protein